ncbi:hypothetical protein H0H92_001037, partial [Tricholoma furcatifolium]
MAQGSNSGNVYNNIGRDNYIAGIQIFCTDPHAGEDYAKLPVGIIDVQNFVPTDKTCLSKLNVSKDAGRKGSKACLDGTRVALIQRIYDWALDSSGERTLLLSGAAGKGKSAIAHTIAQKLESSDKAIVPFFAFNRSVQDRSSSQLIPTWMKHLADCNTNFLSHLQDLTEDEISSTDIVDQ